MKWRASAASNIALIKYMGCSPRGNRLPVNASLSYTLAGLTSTVELELYEGEQDTWQAFPEQAGPFMPILSSKEQARFLDHLAFLKKQFAGSLSDFSSKPAYFMVRSGNNFQAACGLASSASSFAALTLCAIKALLALCPEKYRPPLEPSVLAAWSRQGSGSSCRSFFSPWSLWEGESVSALDLPYPRLRHHVVLVDAKKKEISSSEAHRRVLSSPLFVGRAERAKTRLLQLLHFMNEKNWLKMYSIVYEEFLDMHALFETAEDAFSYQQPGSLRVLAYLQEFWHKEKDGPLITMDAGPNVHLLFRPDQEKMAQMLLTRLEAIL